MADKIAVQSLNLSANAIREMTGWPKDMTNDYLTNLQNFLEIASQIEVVIDRVTINEENIIVNAENIQVNADNILNLEYRVFGSARPEPYDREAGYNEAVYVTLPDTDPQGYYIALQSIEAPAGTFNPALWRRVSLQGNNALINEVAIESVNTFAMAAYGGLSAIGAMSAVGTSTFIKFTFGDIIYQSPLGITQSLANDSLRFNKAGVYEVAFNLYMTHDTNPGDREWLMRLAPLSDPNSGPLFYTLISANTASTSMQIVIPIVVDEEKIGVDYSILIKSSPAQTTNIIVKDSRYTAKSIGLFEGELI